MKKLLQSRKVFSIASLLVLVLILVGCANLNANAAFKGLSDDTSILSKSDDLPRLGEVTFKGVVESVSADALMVSGLNFRVDTQTLLPSALVSGDFVEVKALLLPDQSRYALAVKLEDDSSDDSEFKFYGIVEAMNGETWLISGETVRIAQTAVVSSAAAIGSLVEVEGRIVDGELVAYKIQIEDDDDDRSTPAPGNEVEFRGLIESISGGTYTIAGKTVNTSPSTELQGNLVVGAFVKVHATPQADGSYLAREIEIEDEDDQNDDRGTQVPGSEVEFSGVIESINGSTYAIAGKSVLTSPATELKGSLVIGAFVKVHALLQADGTYLAREIEIEDDDDRNDDSGSGSDDDSNDDSDSGSDDDSNDDSGSGSDDDNDDDNDDDDSGSGSNDDDDDDDDNNDGDDD